MDEPRGAQRFLFLDALRGLGAFIVMLYHFAEFLDISLVPIGFAFVDFFFVLSGFVIAHAYRDRIAAGLSMTAFMAQRLARLYPLYLIGLLLGGIVLLLRSEAGMTEMGATSALISIVANLFYLPYFHSMTNRVFGMEFVGELFPANSPAWSLFFELMVNLLFVALVRIRTILLAATVLAAYGILVFRVYAGFGVGGWGMENLSSGVPRVYYGFFAGYLLQVLFTHPSMRDLHRRLASLSPFVVAFVLAAICGIASLDLADLRISFIVAVSSFPVLVLLGATVAVPRSLVSLCIWMGALSYPVYCLHYPIGLGFEYLVMQGAIRPPVSVLLAMEVGLTLVAAWLANRFYEKRARDLVASLLLRPVPSAASEKI
jgi:peptidoglycan/LPS O-acetylase OafA/YrhL